MRANNNQTKASPLSSSIEAAVDAPWHADAMSEAGNAVQTLATMLRSSFPNSVIFICVGNNDVVPDYYLQLDDGRNNARDDGDERKMTEIATTTTSMGMLSVLYEALGDMVTRKRVHHHRYYCPLMNQPSSRVDISLAQSTRRSLRY